MLIHTLGTKSAAWNYITNITHLHFPQNIQSTLWNTSSLTFHGTKATILVITCTVSKGQKNLLLLFIKQPQKCIGYSLKIVSTSAFLLERTEEQNQNDRYYYEHREEAHQIQKAEALQKQPTIHLQNLQRSNPQIQHPSSISNLHLYMSDDKLE